MVALLFVCLGNICRSPLAQGVFEHRAANAGLAARAESAGTGDWHVGAPPDRRSIAVASAHGLDITTQRARQICREDFFRFDAIVAMDAQNLRDVQAACPEAATARLVRLMDFAGGGDVPDPYHGTAGDFEAVLALIEKGVSGLIGALKSGSSLADIKNTPGTARDV